MKTPGGTFGIVPQSIAYDHHLPPPACGQQCRMILDTINQIRQLFGLEPVCLNARVKAAAVSSISGSTVEDALTDSGVVCAVSVLPSL